MLGGRAILTGSVKDFGTLKSTLRTNFFICYGSLFHKDYMLHCVK